MSNWRPCSLLNGLSKGFATTRGGSHQPAKRPNQSNHMYLDQPCSFLTKIMERQQLKVSRKTSKKCQSEFYLGPSRNNLIFGAKHSNVQKMKRPISTKTSTGRRLNVWKLSGFPEHHFATSSTSFFRVVDVVLKGNFPAKSFSSSAL